MSGRHAEEDGYYNRVTACVSAEVDGFNVFSILDVNVSVVRTEEPPRFHTVVEEVSRALNGVKTRDEFVVVAEKGEFFGEPEWKVEALLGAPFRYAETVAERELVDMAHKLAYNVYRGVMQGLGSATPTCGPG
ncbi:MAG: DUF2209 domain-containing protein [Methanopyri archaeon]|nr:DUF2209 domain-containing protein [Methanopyri archaeon]